MRSKYIRSRSSKKNGRKHESASVRFPDFTLKSFVGESPISQQNRDDQNKRTLPQSMNRKKRDKQGRNGNEHGRDRSKEPPSRKRD